MPDIAQAPNRTIATALPLVMMVAIFLLSSVPGTIMPDDPAAYRVFLWVPPDVQNLLHIPVFGLLAALWFRAACAWLHRRGPSSALALTITIGYGWFDEWHQMHVPGRYGSLTDFALDALGAVLAIAVLLLHTRSGGSQ